MNKVFWVLMCFWVMILTWSLISGMTQCSHDLSSIECEMCEWNQWNDEDKCWDKYHQTWSTCLWSRPPVPSPNIDKE